MFPNEKLKITICQIMSIDQRLVLPGIWYIFSIYSVFGIWYTVFSIRYSVFVHVK